MPGVCLSSFPHLLRAQGDEAVLGGAVGQAVTGMGGQRSPEQSLYSVGKAARPGPGPCCRI